VRFSSINVASTRGLWFVRRVYPNSRHSSPPSKPRRVPLPNACDDKALVSLLRSEMERGARELRDVSDLSARVLAFLPLETKAGYSGGPYLRMRLLSFSVKRSQSVHRAINSCSVYPQGCVVRSASTEATKPGKISSIILTVNANGSPRKHLSTALFIGLGTPPNPRKSSFPL